MTRCGGNGAFQLVCGCAPAVGASSQSAATESAGRPAARMISPARGVAVLEHGPRERVKQPRLPEALGAGWRRGRDSNPRYAFWAYTHFPGVRLQPLGHLSANQTWPGLRPDENASASDGESSAALESGRAA